MGTVYGSGGEFIFTAAVKFLAGKKPLPKEDYEKLDTWSRARAFTVAGYGSAELLQAFLDTLQKAAEEGTTMEQFRRDMNTFLEDRGYAGMNRWKSDNIFRTNVQTAFNAGHYLSMSRPATKKLRPFWRYRTAGDKEVRESHAAMEGRIFRADDPIWDIWYPPNGFKCRCSVVSLTKQAAERLGIPVDDKAPYEVDYGTGEIRMVMPDKGFSGNPAKGMWEPDLSGISPALRKAYRSRKPDGK